MSVTTKIGRNDPCHCGSGRKYKRCHLDIDEKARLASRPPAPERLIQPEEPFESQNRARISPAMLGPLGAMPRVKTAFEMLKWVKNSDLFKRDLKLQRLIEENKTVFDYLGSEREIEAAHDSLKPYEAEFRKLLEDESAFLQRCTTLFDEEAFQPLRFTAADVERAFQQTGFPEDQTPEEDLSKIILDAIRFLASPDHRDQLSMELMMLLPKYTGQSRWLDARLVAFAAQGILQNPEPTHPFLVRMFCFGLEAWEDQREQEKKALLLELGLDLDQGLAPEEIDAWVAQHVSDPAKAARLEQLQAAHPSLFRSSTSSLEGLARQSIQILDREDSECLWLSREEIEPWVPFLKQKLDAMLESYRPEDDQPIPEERRTEAFGRIYLPAMREVAKSIFTPERIRKLTQDLRAYRNRLFAAGEKTASFWAMSAITYVEPEDDPSQNVFLVNLCARSIHGLQPSAKSAV